MLLTSLIADSLALGPHWMYDRAEIVAKFPHLNALHAPATTYHPGKQAGDQTHLGDQTKILAASLIATEGEPDETHFMNEWKAFWAAPTTKTYRDKATKTVLETNAPASSTELAGVARTAPLVSILLKRGLRGDALAEAIYRNVSCTHASGVSQKATQTLADVLTQLSDGKSLAEILPADPFPKMEAGEAIEELGQSCDISAALPSSFLLLRRFGNDPGAALIQNALAGGDSAARGLFMGIILGFSHPKLPESWEQQLRAKPLVDQFERLL